MTEACGYSYVLNNPLRYTDPSGYITQEMYMLAQRIIANLDSYDDVNLTIGGGDISGTINGIMVDYSGLSLDASAAYNLWHALGGKKSGIVPYSRCNNNISPASRGHWMKWFSHFGNETVPFTLSNATNMDPVSEQGGRIDLQGEKVVTQMVDKFREIHRNRGINPYSGNYYHVHDIVDASSLPEKYWFNRIFGSMTNDGAKGTSYFGDKAAQWYLVDRNFLNNYGENYISYIYGDHPGGDMYRIRAMHNNETIISLIFYDYDLYQTMYNRIFK